MKSEKLKVKSACQTTLATAHAIVIAPFGLPDEAIGRAGGEQAWTGLPDEAIAK